MARPVTKCPLASTRIPYLSIAFGGHLENLCPHKALEKRYEKDLKSLDGNVVWVRVPPPAPVELLPRLQPLTMAMIAGFVAMLWLRDWSNIRSLRRRAQAFFSA